MKLSTIGIIWILILSLFTGCVPICGDDCNNGICDAATGTCQCDISFENSSSFLFCDRLITEKFIGNWQIDTGCDSISNLTHGVTSELVNPYLDSAYNQIRIKNALNKSCDGEENTLIVQAQANDSALYVINGACMGDSLLYFKGQLEKDGRLHLVIKWASQDTCEVFYKK